MNRCKVPILESEGERKRARNNPGKKKKKQTKKRSVYGDRLGSLNGIHASCGGEGLGVEGKSLTRNRTGMALGDVPPPGRIRGKT